MSYFDHTYTSARHIPSPRHVYNHLGVMVSQPHMRPDASGTPRPDMVEITVETVSPCCSTLSTVHYCPVEEWPQHVLEATVAMIADIDRMIDFLRSQRNRLAAANDQLSRECMIGDYERPQP